MLDGTIKDDQKQTHKAPPVKAAMGKAARKSPQSPKFVNTVVNGQGHVERVKIPENKDRVVQTVISMESQGGTILPQWSHLTGQIQALEAAGKKPHLVLTADKLANNSSPQSRREMADGEKYKYHVVSQEEVERTGLDRVRAHKTAAKARNSARAEHCASLQKTRGYVPLM